MAATQSVADLLGGGHDVAHVRLALLGERGGDGDQDRVDLCEAVEVRGGVELPLLRRLGEPLGPEVLDVPLAGTELFHLALVDVEPDDREPVFTERQRQRKADVAHPHDPHLGRSLLDRLSETVLEVGHVLHDFRWLRASLAAFSGTTGP